MMKQLSRFTLIVVFLLSGIVVFSQNTSAELSLAVEDQFVYNNSVMINNVVSDSFGFIVIHADNGDGAAGAVLGYRSISPGINTDVIVPLDIANATPTLFAMLHTDDGQLGVYEFGTVEGLDEPVTIEDTVVVQAFNVAVISMTDQIPDENNSLTAHSIVSPVAGWLVIHADDGNGAPGAILGQTFVPAGTSLDVNVSLEGAITNALYPMLHEDTGAAEVYEFGTVEGADAPLQVNGRTAVSSILSVPTIRLTDQIVLGSDATASDAAYSYLQVDGVLAESRAWLVVHAADENGNPGEVIGYAPVQAGFNANVIVEMNSTNVTPVLFPMLHEDTGESDVYEFGTVEGVDLPIRVNEQVVVVPVNVAPNIHFAGSLRGTTLTIDSTLIDGPGWLVIHADDGNGAAGAVLGYTPLLAGLNTNVVVELTEGEITGTLFPMLHYDNNQQGVYEFGTIENADGPVIVNGNIIVGHLNPAILD